MIKDNRILFYTNDVEDITLDADLIESLELIELDTLNINATKNLCKSPFQNEICKFHFIIGYEEEESMSSKEICKTYKQYTNSCIVGKYKVNDNIEPSFLILTEDQDKDSSFYEFRLFMLNQFNGKISSIIEVSRDWNTPYEVNKSYSVFSEGNYIFYENYDATDLIIGNEQSSSLLSKGVFTIGSNGKIQLQ